MTAKKTTKKTTKKATIIKATIIKGTAKRKDPNKSKAAIAKKKNVATSKAKGKYTKPGAMMRDLLIERKFTDEEIFEKVSKAFPDKIVKQTYCNNWRHWLNNLSGMEGVKKNPFERLFKIDGKLVPKSQKPASPKKARKTYTSDNDPLKKVAGIDLHTNKTAKKKVAKRVVRKLASKNTTT